MLKKIKAWWEKINTPYYKRSLESLQADEKKDRTTDHVCLTVFLFTYILPFFLVFMMINLVKMMVNIEVTEIKTLIIVPAILLGFLAILIYFCYISLFISNIYTAGGIQTNLKHMTIQLKIMEQNQNKNNIVFKKKEDEKPCQTVMEKAQEKEAGDPVNVKAAGKKENVK